jgi:hypothetical protein
MKMALQKSDVFAIGRGSLTDNSNAAILYTANNLVGTWDSGTTYSQYNVVEFSGRVYRSKVNSNLNLQPSTNPNSWETLYIGPKDGDVAFVILGSSSTILQRGNGLWAPLAGQPLTVSLNDGQVVATPAFVFLGSSKAFAQMEYTVRRGTGQGRKRRGIMNILNDTVATVEYDHEFNELGLDVNMYMTWDMSGGNARLMYTSGTEGTQLELKYVLRGWS